MNGLSKGLKEMVPVEAARDEPSKWCVIRLFC